MNAPATNTFSTANPHALATILEASETKSIIASRDIFDASGIKLWARDMPVSTALQRKLLDRKLRNPLETCLMAEDGVTSQTLAAGHRQLLDSTSPLAAMLRPSAAAHPAGSGAPAAAFGGPAAADGRPGVTPGESFDHAVQAMALAGALMITHGGGTSEVRLAMLAGLLHDLGEMYIDPRHGEADADAALDFTATSSWWCTRTWARCCCRS
jgi:hypothetical protein